MASSDAGTVSTSAGTTTPARPDYGTLGKKMHVKTNYYKIVLRPKARTWQ